MTFDTEHTDFPAMRFGHPVDIVQSQAETGSSPLTVPVDSCRPLELLENLFLILVRDTESVIFHPDPCISIIRTDRNIDPDGISGIFDGIVDQVADRFFQKLCITIYQLLQYIGSKQSLLTRFHRKLLYQIIDNRGNPKLLIIKPQLPTFHL